MKKILSLVLSFLAFVLACEGGGDAGVTHAQNVNARVEKRRHATPRARKSPPQGTKPVAAAADVLATKPTVHAVKETELKTLLQSSAVQGRPLLVNFWATWCAPCKQEFPDLVKIDGEYNTRGLDFATVSLDDLSEAATGVPDFLQQMSAARMPAFLLNADDQDAAINLVDPSWHGELPATFLYDRQGKIVYTHKGRIKLAELQSAIEKTLGAK